jgi:hypothetical protein
MSDIKMSIWQSGSDKRMLGCICPSCKKIVIISVDITPGFSDHGNIKCLCGNDLGEHRIDAGYDIKYLEEKHGKTTADVL